jgi:hypothetical protein
MSSVPATFNFLELEAKLLEAEKQGIGASYYLTEMAKNEASSLVEKEVLKWLAPVVHAIFTDLMTYEELQRFNTRLSGNCVELRAWLVLFWFRIRIGVPASVVFGALSWKARQIERGN